MCSSASRDIVSGVMRCKTRPSTAGPAVCDCGVMKLFGGPGESATERSKGCVGRSVLLEVLFVGL